LSKQVLGERREGGLVPSPSEGGSTQKTKAHKRCTHFSDLQLLAWGRRKEEGGSPRGLGSEKWRSTPTDSEMRRSAQFVKVEGKPDVLIE